MYGVRTSSRPLACAMACAICSRNIDTLNTTPSFRLHFQRSRPKLLFFQKVEDVAIPEVVEALRNTPVRTCSLCGTKGNTGRICGPPEDLFQLFKPDQAWKILGFQGCCYARVTHDLKKDGSHLFVDYGRFRDSAKELNVTLRDMGYKDNNVLVRFPYASLAFTHSRRGLTPATKGGGFDHRAREKKGLVQSCANSGAQHNHTGATLHSCARQRHSTESKTQARAFVDRGKRADWCGNPKP